MGVWSHFTWSWFEWMCRSRISFSFFEHYNTGWLDNFCTHWLWICYWETEGGTWKKSLGMQIPGVGCPAVMLRRSACVILQRLRFNSLQLQASWKLILLTGCSWAQCPIREISPHTPLCFPYPLSPVLTSINLFIYLGIFCQEVLYLVSPCVWPCFAAAWHHFQYNATMIQMIR